jgi:dimeric dUTPase (all-alpha-NTP-PPase superfamily)
MDLQQVLQQDLPPLGVGADCIKENLLWLVVEVGEVIQELHVKPWRQNSPPMDLEKVQSELVDCLQFLLNAMNAAEITEPVLEKLMTKHRNKVLKRIREGY